MEIRKVKISDINPAPYNPRIDLKPGDKEYEKLKRSIETFGYIDPLIWNARTGNLVGGHQRLKIFRNQGIQEIDVSVVDLPSDREKFLNIALNRISGSWNYDSLSLLIEELSKIDLPDFSIEDTGFDLPEISGILDRAIQIKEDDFVLTEEEQKPENVITKSGDLIELGQHRLLCGDSANPGDIAKLLGDKKIDLIFTDPPYNVAYYGGNRPVPENARPKSCGHWERIYNDNLSQEEYEAWLGKIFGNITPYIAAGAPFYIWNGHRQFGPMHFFLEKLGFHISTVITWAKESFAIGYGDYNQQTEFLLYGWLEDNGAHRWYGPDNETTIWQIKRESTATYEHPTQKPVALAGRAITNSSKRGDTILDVFMGSGTTLIAAEKLKRTCYGVEISPSYCDQIVRRYIKLVGPGGVTAEIRAKYEGSDVTNA